MLRNTSRRSESWPRSFLNEVLSLNAQEYLVVNKSANNFILNEVLSLNAQESGQDT